MQPSPWQSGPDFVVCPFDTTHSLPAAHILAHMLKVHAHEPLRTAINAMSRVSKPLQTNPQLSIKPSPSPTPAVAVSVQSNQPNVYVTKRRNDDIAGAVVQQRALPQPPAANDATGEYIHDTRCKIHVGYCPPDIPEPVVREYFSQFGRIINIVHSQGKKCYFVEFATAHEADAAIRATGPNPRRQVQQFTIFVHPSLPPGTQRVNARPAVSPDRDSASSQQSPSYSGITQALSGNTPTALQVAVQMQQQQQLQQQQQQQQVSAAPQAIQRQHSDPSSGMASSASFDDQLRVTDPPSKTPTATIMLHNVPCVMTEEEVKAALKQCGAPGSAIAITLIASLPQATIRSVVIDYKSVTEATATIEALRGADVLSHFRGQKVTSQFA